MRDEYFRSCLYCFREKDSLKKGVKRFFQIFFGNYDEKYRWIYLLRNKTMSKLKAGVKKCLKVVRIRWI